MSAPEKNYFTIWAPASQVKTVDCVYKQEILKNLQAADSLSHPRPAFPKEKRFNFSSSWFPVTCYGQFAPPVCKELNICMQLENFVCL